MPSVGSVAAKFDYTAKLNRYFGPILDIWRPPGQERKVKLGLGLAVFYSIVSVLIFNFQHHITGVVNSSEICSNQFLYDAMSWILPKAAYHCDLMRYSTFLTAMSFTPSLFFHPYREITLVLDLWIFFVFLAQSALSFTLWKGNRHGRNELIRVFRERRVMSINWMLLMFLVIGMDIFFALFDAPLVEQPWERRPWINMLGDYYGLGAGLLTGIVAVTSLVIYVGLGMSLAFLKSFSKNVRNP